MMISNDILQTWTSNTIPLKDWTPETRKTFWHARKWAITQKPSALSEEFITALNEADRKLFLHWNPVLLLSPLFAWVLLIVGIVVEILFLWTWENIFINTEDSLLVFVALFVMLLAQYIVIHLPSHFLVCKIVGIDVWKTFIAASSLRKGPFPLNYVFALAVIPGLKYDLASFLRQSKVRRALMLSAGIWIPYTLLVLNLSIFVFFPIFSQPTIITIFISIFLVVFIISGVLSSGLWYGDLYKARMIYKKEPNMLVEFEK